MTRECFLTSRLAENKIQFFFSLTENINLDSYRSKVGLVGQYKDNKCADT